SERTSININGLETRNHPYKILSNASSNLNNPRGLARHRHRRNLRNKEEENWRRRHLTPSKPNPDES
ncbi:hypothetical protein LINPERHAP1_LOCUS32734, partial [Linum perenne]